MEFYLFRTHPDNLKQLTDISAIETLSPSPLILKNDNNILKYSVEDRRSQHFTYKSDKPVVFYSDPRTYKAAKNNGERMQYIRSEAKKLHPKTANQVDFMYAIFIQHLYGEYIPKDENHQYDNLYSLEKPLKILDNLSDEQTIIKWLEGKSKVTIDKIISLPDEHNYIKIQQRLVNEGFLSGVSLSNIYLSRGQYRRAVETLEKIKQTSKFKATEEQYNFITEPFFDFKKQNHSYLAGVKPTIKFEHRNVKSITIETQRIDTKKFINNLENLGLSSLNISSKNILDNKKEINLKQYFTTDIQTFKQNISKHEPYTNHTSSFTLPITKPGTYLVSVKTKDNKKVQTVITLDNIVTTVHNTNKGIQIHTLDAKTGKPIQGAKVKLIGLLRNKSRGEQISTSTLTGLSDKSGSFFVKIDKLDLLKNWIIHTSYSEDHSYTKPESLYPLLDRDNSPVKAVILTDKPIYKQGDTINIKG